MRIKSAALVAVLLLVASGAQAGTIYTDKAIFDDLVSGRTQALSEDFQSHSLISIPNPTPIDGGSAEVVAASSSDIFAGGPTLQYWAGTFGVSVRGPGSSNLGLSAISFDFNALAGQVSFLGTSGTDIATGLPFFQWNFVGWIGTGSETLNSADFLEFDAPFIDNIRGFGPAASTVPLPSAAWAGLGLLGVIGAVRRYRRRNAA